MNGRNPSGGGNGDCCDALDDTRPNSSVPVVVSSRRVFGAVEAFLDRENMLGIVQRDDELAIF